MLLVDCRSTSIDRAQLELILNGGTNRGSDTANVSPVFFWPFDRYPPWYMTILYFAAAAIENATALTPATGYICFGPEPNIKSVRLRRPDQHLAPLREFATSRTQQPQSIELNSHCPICQYRAHCRKPAIEEDNLSLVSSIPPKERRKLEAKGITTITQLSYTYRPRRRSRPHATPRPKNTLVTNKNDNRLKALAIRKKQVHILSAENTTTPGTPIYFDIEGIPGADIYYLVGMRFKVAGEWIERSYWANTRTEERDVWKQCLKHNPRHRQSATDPLWQL